MIIGASLLLLSAAFGGADKSAMDARLRTVTTIFVAGNNQAAEKARERLSKGKACLILATNKDGADGVLELSESSTGDPGLFGTFGRRHTVASAILTLRSGDLVWSASERWSDSPLKSGAKVAGNLLARKLEKVACGKRKGK